ncbi:MAG: FAD-binding protein [Chloroflexi bacterium]|nr:MAG: FAD-binding protein [Chloroflexota bacterium]TME18780.1 MAG: FAD-binding protein [Chloroflexota bacterium]
MSDLLERLQAIVGPDHVVSGEALEEYTHDATFLESPLEAAVLPGSTEEVAAVVKLCAETGTSLTTRGAGSGLVGGPVPLGRGIVLGMERFRHLEIDAANLMAVAGAGVVTGDLDAAAAEHGLMYPPDPASLAISTIGGNVACNSGGPHCLKYGLTADYVVGLTVVLADGSVLNLGGKLRKRSSGYRLMALFVGSEGTLGIVTEVIVKLIPRPRHQATAMVGYDTIEAAAEAVRTVLQSGHFPAALELINREALELIRDHLPAGFKSGHEAVLLIEQDGNDQEQVLLQLAEMVELMGGVDNRVAQSGAERDGIWRARRQFGHILMALRKNVFSEDIAVPISKIPEMVHRFHELGLKNGVSLPTVAHAGDGNLHPAFLFDDDQRHLISPLAAQIFRDAVELGGTISAEHGLGALKRDFAILEHGSEAIGWWRRLKDVFDPQGLLNPHKVFPEQPADDHFLDRQPGWGKKLASGRDRSEVSA